MKTKPTRKRARLITLCVSRQTAEILRTILASVGGRPFAGHPRGNMDALLDLLDRKRISPISDSLLDKQGSIYIEWTPRGLKELRENKR